MKKTDKRGGKRKGSGRPKGSGKKDKTKVIRIPVKFDENVKNFVLDLTREDLHKAGILSDDNIKNLNDAGL